MARKSTRQPEGPQGPAALTIARSDAEAKIAARIEKAEEVRQKLGAAAQDSGASAMEAYEGWDSHNYHMLERMFTTREVADEYYYAGPPAKVLRMDGGGTWLGRPQTRHVDPELPEKLEAKLWE
jgi:hypothetical protein